MQKDLQLTGNRYNVIAQTLFPAYLLAELPSNYILVKLTPKIWLSFLVMRGVRYSPAWICKQLESRRLPSLLAGWL